jgi:DNA replication initiation complex subunit (GINS family)
MIREIQSYHMIHWFHLIKSSKENILKYQIEKIVSKQHSPETQNQTSGTENQN